MMTSHRTHCAWCDCSLTDAKSETRRSTETLCPECQRTFEMEANRSYHPMEERRPHND